MNNEEKTKKCLQIRSRAILIPQCLLDNGKFQKDCISCKYYVRKS